VNRYAREFIVSSTLVRLGRFSVTNEKSLFSVPLQPERLQTISAKSRMTFPEEYQRVKLEAKKGS